MTAGGLVALCGLYFGDEAYGNWAGLRRSVEYLEPALHLGYLRFHLEDQDATEALVRRHSFIFGSENTVHQEPRALSVIA